MDKIRVTYILLAVESAILFYLYQLKAVSRCGEIGQSAGVIMNVCRDYPLGALQYPQAVGAVGLTLVATLLLMASQTLPGKKSAAKKPAKKPKK